MNWTIQNKISRLAGKICASTFSKRFIKPYVKIYKINHLEAEKPLEEYQSLTDFFTRKLKKDERKISNENNSITSPCDGIITQIGEISSGKIIQAKGITYSVDDLVCQEAEMIEKFKDGLFMTIYLSPKDYHRIHSPIDGFVEKTTYVPGRLYPVHKKATASIKGLYTKNERLISYLNTEIGKVAIAKIGAFIVGSVKVSYGNFTTNKENGNYETYVLENEVFYKKGEEIGYFEFGSKVILLFEKDCIKFNESLIEGSVIKMGESIGIKKT